MTQNEKAAREQLVDAARQVASKGLSHGTTGNVSLRFEDRILLTPTGGSLATVEPHELAAIDDQGNVLSPERPTKEAFFHLAVYNSRPEARAIVHTHSLHATAVSCKAGLDERDALPPMTAYYAMKVRALPLVSYYPPGDKALADEVGRIAQDDSVMLLRNHGPVIASSKIDTAVAIAEELEQTARLYLLLAGQELSPLSPEERERLYAAATQ